MRRRSIAFGTQVSFAAVLIVAAASAQDQQGSVPALKNGHLVVWVVKAPAPRAGTPSVAAAAPATVPTTLQEKSVGDFGQPAAGFGTDSANYGVSSTSDKIARVPANTAAADPDNAVAAAAGYHEQTANSYGQTSSTYGTAAANHGQTAASLGQSASNYGQSAGSYGQSAGSFGHSVTNLGQAAQQPAPKPVQTALAPTLRSQYPGLQAQFVDVDAARLRARLKAVDGSASSPDVVIFEGFPASWLGPTQDVREMAVSVEAGAVPGPPGSSAGVRTMLLKRAPHPETARAFVNYLDEQGAQPAESAK
jgi:hypothetical protein